MLSLYVTGLLLQLGWHDLEALREKLSQVRQLTECLWEVKKEQWRGPRIWGRVSDEISTPVQHFLAN